MNPPGLSGSVSSARLDIASGPGDHPFKNSLSGQMIRI